jgi:hypothetical protein
MPTHYRWVLIVALDDIKILFNIIKMSNANLTTSQAMPVENYSVVTQSENGTQFSPGMKTVFRVPSHLSYVDFHTSYLFFDFEVKNELGKMEFTNGGPEMLIRTWRVLIAGHVVEEIDHPNVLIKALKYDFGQDLGMAEISKVINKSGKGTGYQGLNKYGTAGVTDVAAGVCDKIKVVLDLDFSGIFGSTQTFPVGMTGDVTIEIVWEEARRSLKLLDSGRLPLKLTDATHHRASDGCAIVDLAGGAAVTQITLKESEQSYQPNLCSHLTANVEDCPFSLGQSLTIKGRNGVTNAAYSGASTGNITAIDDDGGSIRLTVGFADPVNAIVNASVAFHTNGPTPVTDATQTWDNKGTLSYEVSVPTLALTVVVPPAQYVQAQAEKVNREGLAIDVPTYTCYKANTYAGIKSATIDIPCYASRARALLAIGVGQQALGGNNVLAGYSAQGEYDDLDQYQWQIGEIREPVRPVSCSNLSTYQENVAQEQLTELDKALRASGCDVRSLTKHKDNFIVGRALSAYGGSIPLTMKGARLYIDYLENDKRTGAAVAVTAKNWFVLLPPSA